MYYAPNIAYREWTNSTQIEAKLKYKGPLHAEWLAKWPTKSRISRTFWMIAQPSVMSTCIFYDPKVAISSLLEGTWLACSIDKWYNLQRWLWWVSTMSKLKSPSTQSNTSNEQLQSPSTGIPLFHQTSQLFAFKDQYKPPQLTSTT